MAAHLVVGKNHLPPELFRFCELFGGENGMGLGHDTHEGLHQRLLLFGDPVKIPPGFRRIDFSLSHEAHDVDLENMDGGSFHDGLFLKGGLEVDEGFDLVRGELEAILVHEVEGNGAPMHDHSFHHPVMHAMGHGGGGGGSNHKTCGESEGGARAANGLFLIDRSPWLVCEFAEISACFSGYQRSLEK